MTILPNNSVLQAIREHAEYAYSESISKFADTFAAYLWDCAMNGDGEITYSDPWGRSCTTFELSEAERIVFGVDCRMVSLVENEQGFVYVEQIIEAA